MHTKGRFAGTVAVVSAWLVLLASTASAAPLQFSTGTRWIEIPIDQPAASPVLAMFGRVDGDTRADLVLYNYVRGEAYVGISDGTRFGPPRLYSSGLPRFNEPTFEAALGDLNGDALDDFVIMNHGADNVPGAATAVVALNSGTGFAYPPQSTWNESWCASYQRCLADDIDGDGKADLVAFTPDFGLVWGTLSTGTSFGANATWNDYFCIRGEICALGDMNGDGKADAILFKPNAPEGQKGNVLWARSTGSAFVDVQYGHGFFCIEAETCLVGDVNGDARSDVVLVKGWGTGAPTLEVLVSLSNGQQFINAEPFAWAYPPPFNPGSTSFGSFGLADVTGDGRADLVEWGAATAPTAGGGSRTTGFAVDVFPTGQPGAPPAPGGGVPLPPEERGFSSIAIYNCETEQHQLFYWNIDQTTRAVVDQSGLTDAMYSEAGTCPDLNDPPQTFELEAGHVHSLIAVDPQAIGCDGTNNPEIVGCVKASISVVGAANGPICQWIIGAQEPAC